MRKALNKMFKVCKIGACSLYPVGTKVWHKPVKIYPSFLQKNYCQKSQKVVVSYTTWGAVEDLLSFQVRERKNTGHADWGFLNVSRLFLELGREKSYQNFYATKESEENSR